MFCDTSCVTFFTRHFGTGGRGGSSLFGILIELFRRTIPFKKKNILSEVGSLVKNVKHDVSQNI